MLFFVINGLVSRTTMLDGSNLNGTGKASAFEVPSQVFDSGDIADVVLTSAATMAVDGLRHIMTPDHEKIAWHGNLLFVNYMDGNPRYSGLTRQIVESRQRRYKEEGLLLQSAASQDGIRGPNVEMLAHVDPTSGVAVDSLRKVHGTLDASSEGLPSYIKFISQGKFSVEGLAFLHERAEGRPVAEIAALWKNPEYAADTKFALYRQALQDAAARRELLFMGVVGPEYAAIRRAWGDRVVHRLGDPASIEGEDAAESVRIYPVVIDPLSFFDELIEERNVACKAGDSGKQYLREVMLWYFLDGLDRNILDHTTNERVEELQSV